MNWYTADQHHGHKNIIRQCNRPWKSIDRMDRDIITNMNDALKPGDTLHHIGDFCWFGPDRMHFYETLMRKYRDDVTHHLILGNHDELNPFKYVKLGFASIHTSLKIDSAFGHTFILNHDPCVHDIVKDIGILICGHIHGLFKIAHRTINVGVDVWDFKPVSEETLITLVEEKFN
jgi:calcineurin-like phosphoesterase family protein